MKNQKIKNQIDYTLDIDTRLNSPEWITGDNELTAIWDEDLQEYIEPDQMIYLGEEALMELLPED